MRLMSAFMPTGYKDWVDRFGNEPRKGSDILVQALEREGVSQVRFGCPFFWHDGVPMALHGCAIMCRADTVPGRGRCLRTLEGPPWRFIRP